MVSHCSLTQPFWASFHERVSLVSWAFTKVLGALLVSVIQEEVALLDGPVHLEAQPQARVLHQVSQDLLSDALKYTITSVSMTSKISEADSFSSQGLTRFLTSNLISAKHSHFPIKCKMALKGR